MSASLRGKRVAIVATHGFEESELSVPLRALSRAGAAVHVVSPETGEIQGMRHFEKGLSVAVNRSVEVADAADYDGAVVPGGLFNPDQLRANDTVRAFVRDLVARGRPVAAICHGPWVLADAGVLAGRTVTSVASIRKDLENAGARWVDREVVVDHGIVTSRTPDDLEAFTEALLACIDGGARAAA